MFGFSPIIIILGFFVFFVSGILIFNKKNNRNKKKYVEPNYKINKPKNNINIKIDLIEKYKEVYKNRTFNVLYDFIIKEYEERIKNTACAFINNKKGFVLFSTEAKENLMVYISHKTEVLAMIGDYIDNKPQGNKIYSIKYSNKHELINIIRNYYHTMSALGIPDIEDEIYYYKEEINNNATDEEIINYLIKNCEDYDPFKGSGLGSARFGIYCQCLGIKNCLDECDIQGI